MSLSDKTGRLEHMQPYASFKTWTSSYLWDFPIHKITPLNMLNEFERTAWKPVSYCFVKKSGGSGNLLSRACSLNMLREFTQNLSEPSNTEIHPK